MARGAIWIASITWILSQFGGALSCSGRQETWVPELPRRDCAAEGRYARKVTVPRTIDASGTTDVAAALANFLNAQPPGTEVHFRAGTYRAEQPIELTDRRQLTLDGDGARLLRTVKGAAGAQDTRTRLSLAFTGGASIVVKDLQIRGASPGAAPGVPHYQADWEAQHGIAALGVQRFVVCRTQINRVLGDFVYIGLDARNLPTRIPARHVHIYDNLFYWSGRQGIAVTGVEELTVQRNQVIEAARTAFDLEPGTDAAPPIRDVVIDHNHVVSPARLFTALGADSVPIVGIVLTNNRVLGAALYIWIVGARVDVVIASNRADALPNGGRMIWLYGVQRVWVVNNIGRIPPGDDPIETTDLAEYHESGNVFTH